MDAANADNANRPLERFIASIRQRITLLRTLERMGMSLGIISPLSAGLAALLWWHGQSPVFCLIVSAAVAIALGAVWGWMERPSQLVTAMEADHQLKACDLFATAWSFRDEPSMDEWIKAVIATANRRAVDLSASQLTLSRLGRRAWGSIGLAMGVALAVASASIFPRSGLADVPRGLFVAPSDLATAQTRIEASRSLESLNRTFHRSTGQGAIDLGDRTLPLDDSDPSSDASTRKPRWPSDRDAGAGDSTGAGSGSSRTKMLSALRSLAADVSARPGTTDSQGQLSGGIGAVGNSAAPVTASVDGKTLASRDSHEAAAPWQGAGWDADRASAGRRMDTGNIPDRYRDFVRGYFDITP